jgi:hypothetical protein
MYGKRVELKPDEKPTEVQPTISCGVQICRNYLFGYCQIIPNMDNEGKCISRSDE